MALGMVMVLGPAVTTANAETAATPTPTPTGAPSPSTTRRAPDNPFTGPVGGLALGTKGVVVDPKVAQVPPAVDASSYVLADLDTGEVLAAKNAHLARPPASTLKTLTAVTLLPRLDKRARYTATQADANMIGSRVGIEAGSAYTIDQLFYGLFLPSGNDAANALGNAAGGVPTAVRMMNDEARRLGAFDTHVVNTSGLDEPGQVSSAYDLALFARNGMARSDFRRYATTLRYNFPGRNGKTYQIQNLNKLLGHYPGAIGVKNGYTTKARNTLVGAAEQNGRRLVVTLMNTGAPSWQRAATLLDWGFTVGAKVKPVGTLVSADDVTLEAAARATPTAPAQQPGLADSPKATTAPDPALPPATATAPSTMRPSAAVIPEQLQRMPIWLWLVGFVFVALASMRVYSHVRSRRGGPA